MERLWAPWRIGYILSDKKEEGCIFCNALNSKDDEKGFVLYRSTLSFIIMNLYPYNAGHIMVVPNRHIDTPLKLTEEEQIDLFRLVNLGIETIQRVMKPDGFNLGMNLGKTAGAGIDDHMHVHIVPRWNGDTNFMSTVSDTKVISEAIRETYNKLKGAIK